MVKQLLLMVQELYQERVFDDFILADKLFAKDLQRLNTCLLVRDDLCGKLALLLELPPIFDDNRKVTSVLFFAADFNLPSYEFNIFPFTLSYCVIFIFILH